MASQSTVVASRDGHHREAGEGAPSSLHRRTGEGRPVEAAMEPSALGAQEKWDGGCGRESEEWRKKEEKGSGLLLY